MATIVFLAAACCSWGGCRGDDDKDEPAPETPPADPAPTAFGIVTHCVTGVTAEPFAQTVECSDVMTGAVIDVLQQIEAWQSAHCPKRLPLLTASGAPTGRCLETAPSQLVALDEAKVRSKLGASPYCAATPGVANGRIVECE
jgi:hypothetical protein